MMRLLSTYQHLSGQDRFLTFWTIMVTENSKEIPMRENENNDEDNDNGEEEEEEIPRENIVNDEDYVDVVKGEDFQE